MVDDADQADLPRRIERLLTGTGTEQVHRLLAQLRGDMDEMRTTLTAQLAPVEEHMRAVARLVSERDPARADRLAEQVAELQTELADQRQDIARRIGAIGDSMRLAAAPAPMLDPDAVRDLVRSEIAALAGEIRGEIASVTPAIKAEVIDALGILGEAGPPDVEPLKVAIVDLREQVQSLSVGVRTDVDVALRARDQQDAQAVDGLGLRITNLSMSVSQALDGVRAQVQAMTDRAASLEAEHAAVLEAVRAEIAGIPIGSADAGDGGQRIAEHLRTVSARIDDLSSQVMSRVASLEQAMRSTAAEAPELEAIEQRLGVLPQISARLAALQALPERVAALEAMAGRIEALAGVPEGLERLSTLPDQIAALGPSAEQMHVLASLQDGVREIAASTQTIGMLPRIEEALARIDGTVGMLASAPAPGDPIEHLAAPLAEIREQLVDLPAIKIAMEGLPDPTAAAERYASTLAEHLASLRHQLGAQLDGVRMDSGERLAELQDRLHDAIRDAAASVNVDETLAPITARVEANGARMQELLASVGSQAEVVQQFSIRLDGLETAVARALLEARTSFDGATTESTAALSRIGQEFAGLADQVRGLSEAAAEVREQLAALPRPAEIAGTVAGDVAKQVEPMVNDLEAASTNVAEIWMRLRGMETTLTEFASLTTKHLRSMLARTESGTRRMEHIAGGETRLGARIDELERRVVDAAKAIDSERDRLFVEALAVMVERLGKRDRTLGRRLRSVIGRSKHTPEPLEDVIEPVVALGAGDRAGERDAEAPVLELRMPAEKPKRKPVARSGAAAKKSRKTTASAARKRDGGRGKPGGETKKPKRVPQNPQAAKKKNVVRRSDATAKRTARAPRDVASPARAPASEASLSLDAAIDAALGSPPPEPPVGSGTAKP